VPTCPDWSLRDLARHLGRVHRRVAATVTSGAQRLVRHDDVPDAEPPRSRDEVATWLLAGGAAVGFEPWAGVTPALAADGIAESLGLLETFGARRADLAGSGETIHVHATTSPRASGW
jgi:hypothetical protein